MFFIDINTFNKDTIKYEVLGKKNSTFCSLNSVGIKARTQSVSLVTILALPDVFLFWDYLIFVLSLDIFRLVKRINPEHITETWRFCGSRDTELFPLIRQPVGQILKTIRLTC